MTQEEIVAEKVAYAREIVPLQPEPVVIPIPDDESPRQRLEEGGGTGTYVPKALQPVATTSGSSPALFITDGFFGQNAEVSPGASIPTIDGVSIILTGSSRPKVILTGSETWVYLHVSLDSFKQVASLAVETTTAEFYPTSTGTDFYVPLAALTFDDGKVVVGGFLLEGSQGYKWCGQHINWGV